MSATSAGRPAASSSGTPWREGGQQVAFGHELLPQEGNPLWEQYSTKAVAQTLKTYSKFTIDYPYPVAISVHTKWIGMEYPMICSTGDVRQRTARTARAPSTA